MTLLTTPEQAYVEGKYKSFINIWTFKVSEDLNNPTPKSNDAMTPPKLEGFMTPRRYV